MSLLKRAAYLYHPAENFVKWYYCCEYLHKSLENLSVYFMVVYVYYIHTRYLGIGWASWNLIQWIPAENNKSFLSWTK